MDGAAEAIFAWLRLDERLTTSGQPTESQLHALAAQGVETVINLALHSHEKALPDERASVAALGMDYVHIPVEFSAPAEADFAAFVAAMEAAKDRRVHVHCIVNARVSAFVYRWRRDVLGIDEALARADMLRIWDPAAHEDGGVWGGFVAPPPK